MVVVVSLIDANMDRVNGKTLSFMDGDGDGDGDAYGDGDVSLWRWWIVIVVRIRRLTIF